ncbi:MAG: hypothetical protein WC881_07685, partial [Elusimicrobiota bacterium]
MNAVRRFAELDSFLADLQPLTPYGRAAKARGELCVQRAALEAEYDLVARALAFLGAEPDAAGRVDEHLRRVPALEFDLAGPLGLGEVFLLKKFLLHTRAALAGLPADLRAAAGAHWSSDGLQALLDKGSDGGAEGEESFRLAESYLPALRQARQRLRALDEKLQRLQDGKRAAVKKRSRIDLAGLDFLLAPADQGQKLSGDPDLAIEPYDAQRIRVGFRVGPEALELGSQREALVAEERTCEAQVLEALSQAAAREEPALHGYRSALERLDLILAKARFALRHGMTRPRLQDPGAPLRIRGGRHVPLEARNRVLGLDYTPLACDLRGRVGVLHGSNMGGKTAVLKTVALLQLLAQSGCFVPAEDFETVVFEHIDYVGEDAREPVSGLSSFGLELHVLLGILGESRARRLVLMDEFAKTTNSREGAALLSAVLGAFTRRPGYYALVSTHLSGLALPEGAWAYRMRGFDAEAFQGFLGAEAGGKLPERLACIHRFMRYELIDDD